MTPKRHFTQETKWKLGMPFVCLLLVSLVSVVFPYNTSVLSKAPSTSKAVRGAPTPAQPSTQSSTRPKYTLLRDSPPERTPEVSTGTEPPDSSAAPVFSADPTLRFETGNIPSITYQVELFTTTHSEKTALYTYPNDVSPSRMAGQIPLSPEPSQPPTKEKKKKKKNQKKNPKKNKKKNKCDQALSFSITGVTGRIEWENKNNNCVSTVLWDISVPKNHIISLRLHELETQNVSFTEDNNVTYYEEPALIKLGINSTNISWYNASFPSLVNKSRVLIFIETPVENMVLNLSFYSQHVDSFPRHIIHSYEKASIQKESAVEYNCSGKHVHIPEGLKCDRINDCIGGEDEANCGYKNAGCGDWVPYRDQCLKFIFIIVNFQVTLLGQEAVPSEAEKACQSNHNAQLAALPDQEGMKILTDVVRRSGFNHVSIGLKKFQPTSLKLEHLYRYTWQWGGRGGPVAYDQQDIQREKDGPLLDCAIFRAYPAHLTPTDCVYTHSPDGYVCMRQNNEASKKLRQVSSVIFSSAVVQSRLESYQSKECSDGSLVQSFHSCKWGSSEASVSSQNNVPMFKCRLGPAVHYTHVCDGLEDCSDGSDESVCSKPRYPPLKDSTFVCQKVQLVALSLRCNGIPDCSDGSDEHFCFFCNWAIFCRGIGCVKWDIAYYINANVCPIYYSLPYGPETVYSPGEIILEGTGMSKMKPATEKCSNSTFRCQSGLCIPSYMINNGEKDCPYGEDEDIPWENVTCPGYYRCHEFGLCLHPDLVCNGVYECPNKDDERYCNLPCPDNCTCEAFAYSCSGTFDSHKYLEVRYLDVSEAHISDNFLQDLYVMEFLRFLNLSDCQLRNVTLTELPQLMILDLSYNFLNDLSSFNLRDLSGVTWLDLSHNPLVAHLDLSFSAFLKLASLTSLETLILTNTDVTSITDRALSPLSKLITLDLSDNKLTAYSAEAFWGVSSLQVLYSDDGKMCCQYFHLNPLNECHAPVDELSSCSDLLRSDFFRVFLWTLSVLSIAGNAGVLVYRTIADERSPLVPFRVLVKNLCASDLLMGVYLMMIGVADELFRGQYVEKEREWRHSAWCTAAGFLAFVSSEASALVICCITLDRLLVLCYPLKASLHLKAKSVIALCCCVWCTCLVLAAVPLMAGLDFYGQNGICLPLPITRQQFSGQFYAFAIFIILNFVLFVLIGVGQLVIYTAIRRTGAATGSKSRQQDTTIARSLFLVVFTDFCCWFPVGLIGLLAFSGVPIPGVVNVWIAIFVLPLNSALNPFLYTLNSLLKKMEKRRMEDCTKRMMAKLQTEIPKLQPNKVEEIALVCIRSKRIQQERFLRLLGLKEDQLSSLEKRSRDKGNTSSICETTRSTAASDVSSSAAIDIE